MKIQEAKRKDIKAIREIEKEYYEGYSCPQSVLKEWIEENGNFLVAKENGKQIAFLFFERISQIKSLPFIHKPQKKSGKYLYVSEIGVLDEYAKTDILSQLFRKLLKKNKENKGIIWVTGGESKHDKNELKLIKKLGFKKLKKIKRWEAYPGHFVDDHWIWLKRLGLGA